MFALDSCDVLVVVLGGLLMTSVASLSLLEVKRGTLTPVDIMTNGRCDITLCRRGGNHELKGSGVAVANRDI
ncbi:hypothetical protein QBC36DRAFT_317645 [Triangularia setosa]|uniref:Uncharacterized protein n=1 Tax=Triangularia setosa TaxID=2587417 RepID=A0AAN6WGM1_9PEZI|nr:hypothetical protein QBC36DRAFT_317645 [Podospora setosa]